MQIDRLLWAYPVDTEQLHCHELFEANIDVWRDCFLSKVNRKKSQRLKNGQTRRIVEL